VIPRPFDSFIGSLEHRGSASPQPRTSVHELRDALLRKNSPGVRGKPQTGPGRLADDSSGSGTAGGGGRAGEQEGAAEDEAVALAETHHLKVKDRLAHRLADGVAHCTDVGAEFPTSIGSSGVRCGCTVFH
jgi:hypothetical protein